MGIKQEVNRELRENYELLRALLSQERALSLKADLGNLEDIIGKQIPEALSKNAPPDYYELYMDFKSEYEKFRDYILYDQLIGKNVVALGGGFSSGKSSFLNALNGEDALPEAIEPTTAVPAYVVWGEDYRVQAINIFDAKVVFQNVLDIQKIAHGFGELECDGEKISEGTALGHVLESVFLATPQQSYRNIAFLDTPGYSKPESEQYSARTDEQIARRQLNTAGLILWFVNAEGGVITQNDIDFIKTLREDIPKLVILTRADRRQDQLAEIMAKVREALTLKGVGNIRGVYAYDKERPEDYDLPEIRRFLEDWNQRTPEPNFALNFKKLFVRCRKFFEDEKNKAGSKLEKLNHASMILSGDGEEEAGEVLDRLIDDFRREIQALTRTGERVRELQDAFFQEIKRVGDVVGIRMPEPSEVELLREDAGNPLTLLRDYNREHNVKPNRELLAVLQNALGDLKPVFPQAAGGGAYQGKLLDILRSYRVAPEEIRFNDVYRRTDAYQKLVRTLAAAEKGE